MVEGEKYPTPRKRKEGLSVRDKCPRGSVRGVRPGEMSGSRTADRSVAVDLAHSSRAVAAFPRLRTQELFCYDAVNCFSSEGRQPICSLDVAFDVSN